jgi:uncharacterized protein (DUF58 family)
MYTGKLIAYLPPHGKSTQLSRIIDQLERIQPGGVADMPAAVREVADRLGRRALVVVLSDFFAPMARVREAFARLRYERHEVLAIQVIDPDEAEFPFRNWSRFRGLEDEKALLTEPALLRKQYLDNFSRHQQDLAESCRALAVEHHTYQTDLPLVDWLTHVISRRSHA